MTVGKVIELLNAEILSSDIDRNKPIETICGSDMMSDVLAFIKKDALLCTGLNNLQVIRTAEMLDVVCICFVRGKTPSPEMLEMAADCGIYILKSDLTMFEACGKLYKEGDYE